MTIAFTHKNTSELEVNDVPNPKIFQIEGYGYDILIKPKCQFWRIGVRFSVDIRATGWSTTHRYNNPQIQHLEICAGTRPNGSWQNPELLQLQRYHIKGTDDILYSCSQYNENTEVRLRIESQPFGKLKVYLDAGNFSSHVELDLGFSKTFQIFGWADFTDYEIDTEVTPYLLPLALDLKEIKAFANQKTSIVIQNLAVFFGMNNCGKTSTLVAACDAYNRKHYSSMDYLGLNRTHPLADFDIEIDGLPDHKKESLQAENRRSRIKKSPGQNELFDWMVELALQDEETRSKILDWVGVHFERWEFMEEKTGRYVTGVQAKVNELHPLSQGTGARAVLPIIIQLYNPHVEFLAIDEPELGLEPRMQREVFQAIKSATEGVNGFPLKRILLATHSHLFLDRDVVNNNFSVQKIDGVVQVVQLADLHELQKVTYKLLGNNPNDLFFPSNVVIVEGLSDHIFLNAIYQAGRRIQLFSSSNVVFHYIDGFEKLPAASEAIVQMLKTQSYTPVYKERICGLFDKPRRNGKMIDDVRKYFEDTTHEKFVLLDLPAIEYYYPLSIINKLFNTNLDLERYSDLVKNFLATILVETQLRGQILNATLSKVELARLIAENIDVAHLDQIDPKILRLLKKADELAYK